MSLSHFVCHRAFFLFMAFNVFYWQSVNLKLGTASFWFHLVLFAFVTSLAPFWIPPPPHHFTPIEKGNPYEITWDLWFCAFWFVRHWERRSAQSTRGLEIDEGNNLVKIFYIKDRPTLTKVQNGMRRDGVERESENGKKISQQFQQNS